MENIDNWSDEQVQQWCAQSEWFSKLPAKPAESMDKREFIKQCLANPQEWRAAFKFLSRPDLVQLPLGKQPLPPVDESCQCCCHPVPLGSFVNIQQYTTKDEGAFEAHRKFIDIQFMLSGREYIEVAPQKALIDMTQEYNPDKDIEFFDNTSVKAIPVEVNPLTFTILFPSDGHKPGIRIGENAPVHKVIIKVPFVKV